MSFHSHPWGPPQPAPPPLGYKQPGRQIDIIDTFISVSLVQGNKAPECRSEAAMNSRWELNNLLILSYLIAFAISYKGKLSREQHVYWKTNGQSSSFKGEALRNPPLKSSRIKPPQEMPRHRAEIQDLSLWSNLFWLSLKAASNSSIAKDTQPCDESCFVYHSKIGTILTTREVTTTAFSHNIAGMPNVRFTASFCVAREEFEEACCLFYYHC